MYAGHTDARLPVFIVKHEACVEGLFRWERPPGNEGCGDVSLPPIVREALKLKQPVLHVVPLVKSEEGRLMNPERLHARCCHTSPVAVAGYDRDILVKGPGVHTFERTDGGTHVGV